MANSLSKDIPKALWQPALENSSTRYHIIGAWVAIIFDPVFGITDYFNIEDWAHLLAIRFGVSAITLVTLLLRKPLNIPSYVIVFVPFLLISLQNAYTFSLIRVEDFTGHSLNYIALFIGGGMFILWNWRFSVAVVGISVMATAVFFNTNHTLSFAEAMVNGGLLLIVVALFMILLIQTRYSLTVRTIKANLALEQTNKALQEQKDIIEEKNRDIMDSIRYAQRIQNATLPELDRLQRSFPDAFVFFQPRDVVSGDFYWFWKGKNKALIAAMDCTGHGVPGAFMSMKGDALLNQIVTTEGITDPDQLLNALHREIRLGLKQHQTNNQDGMDGVVCLLDEASKEVVFSGAKNPLVYIQHGELKVVKGNKFPVGGVQREAQRIFTAHRISCEVPTTIYLFSDGFQDQFGGANNKKFMIKRMKELLQEIHQLPMKEQHAILERVINDWMKVGNEKQIDDILVIGLKVNWGTEGGGLSR